MNGVVIGFFIALALSMLPACTTKKPIRVASIIGLTDELKADLNQDLHGVEVVWDQMRATQVEEVGEKSVSLRTENSYDVVIGGFSKWYFHNMDRGGFIPFRSPEMVSIAPFWRDENLTFVPIMFTSFMFAHRADHSEIPQKWSELFDPANRERWKGKITMVDPTKVLTSEVGVFALYRILGEAKFLAIKDLGVHWTKDYQEGIDRLISGKSEIAITNSQQFVFANPGNSALMLSYPEDGTLPLMSGCGILKGTKNLSAAKKVMAWIFKYKFQKHLIDDRRTYSSLASVPIDPGLRPWEQEIKGLFRWTIPAQEKFKQDEQKIVEAIKKITGS